MSWFVGSCIGGFWWAGGRRVGGLVGGLVIGLVGRYSSECGWLVLIFRLEVVFFLKSSLYLHAAFCMCTEKTNFFGKDD